MNKSCFLSGLFDSEGAIIAKNLENRNITKRWIHFSNNNLKTINLVTKLLKEFEIRHKVKSRIHSGFGSKKIQYEILIYDKKSITNFYKHVKFSIKRKQDLLRKLINSYQK